MFWNVTFIYNAFIRTTDHCKVLTAFVSLFYIFVNMKPWSASNSLVVVVGLLLIMQIIKLFHWKATPTRAFNEIFRIFFNLGKFVKIRDFFLLRQRILDGLNYVYIHNRRSAVLSLSLVLSACTALVSCPATSRLQKHTSLFTEKR